MKAIGKLIKGLSVKSTYCPSDFGLIENHIGEGYCSTGCEECWKRAIEHEYDEGEVNE